MNNLHLKRNIIQTPFRWFNIIKLRENIYILFLIFSSIFCQPVVSQTYEQAIIEKIEVIGTKYTEQNKVLELITIKPGDDISKRDTVLEIRNNIKNIMALGFFNNVVFSTKQGEKGSILQIIVEEKPVLKQINFKGNKTFKEKRLRKETEFDPKKTVFLSDTIIEDYKKNIQKIYSAKGFPSINIEHKTDVNNDNEASLTFTLDEGQKVKIKNIIFHGNKAITSKKLRKVMQTKRSWWFITKRYEEPLFEEDLKRAAQVYRDHGYLDVDVLKGEFETIKKKKKTLLIININIVEGVQYTFDNIEFEGNTLFWDVELREAMLTKPGVVFNESEFFRDKDRIWDLYAEQGYILANSQSEYKKNRENKTVYVFLQIREGRRIYLADVNIEGMITQEDGKTKRTKIKTKDYVIRREIKLASGDVLDWTKIKKAQKDLLNLGYFKKDGVLFRPEATSDPDMMNVICKVEEEKTGLITIGAGYSSEYKGSVFLTLTERNLFGRGQKLSLSADVGQVRKSYDAYFEEPHLLGSEYGLGANIFDQTRQSVGGRDFDESRQGGSLRLSRLIFTEYLTAFMRLKHEKVEISDIDKYRFEIVRRPLVYTDQETTTNSLTLGLTEDTRDYYRSPTKGYRTNVSTEFAGLGGDNEFLKFDLDGSIYHKLFSERDWVLALGAEYGAAWGMGGTDSLPLHERYFVGGSRTVRGFEWGTISPRGDIYRRYRDLELGTSQVIHDRVRIGGEQKLVINTEIRKPLMDVLDGVIFFDTGSAWEDVGDFDLTALRYSIGLGIRIDLPIGALISLDYGIALNPKDDDETQPLHFSLGHTF